MQSQQCVQGPQERERLVRLALLVLTLELQGELRAFNAPAAEQDVCSAHPIRFCSAHPIRFLQHSKACIEALCSSKQPAATLRHTVQVQEPALAARCAACLDRCS